MIRRVLIPNRGEIAVRIACSAREKGIVSVLAHAEDDSRSLAARVCDETTSLGGGDVVETYLNVDRIIDAARKTGADALHPGYGFLSERAELAAACRDAGIIFIGPSPESIEAMGSKSGARQMMHRLGVPVVPGYDGDDQSNETLTSAADRIGFPLLVKASAGGGGKGMRIVRDPAGLPEALQSARREAAAAFGNDHLLLERYVERPRHVEFQILGDSHGSIVHLFERDCSIQRRHQKVIEESPAPQFSAELRSRMAVAALTAAHGVRYENAGTVEFILAPDGQFYFLEMNTRLQVEHPVTELVTGVDLVRAQFEVANGAKLPWRQEELQQRGHAIECRIYAEDPDDRFLPQSGRIGFYEEPAGPGIRVDSGVESGSEIGVRYDPILAKLICHAETRELCIARTARALSDYVILGTRTNISYLRRIVRNRRFTSGEIATSLLEEESGSLVGRLSPEAAAIAGVLATAGSAAGDVAARGDVAADRAIPQTWDLIGRWGR